ncbi:hypothetical protein PR202_gb23071 [Eleusine coracana subsp. coracana]|uniref:Uncharacterized protein n=1 Tax=Eleusine coracana subsp. coracana TaxID=191504 RepID=A0AAV5FHG6_ELECO|nr:hypothetical protein PR202_gb23071 [Eleusine coracana subsp. coracana]
MSSKFCKNNSHATQEARSVTRRNSRHNYLIQESYEDLPSIATGSCYSSRTLVLFVSPSDPHPQIGCGEVPYAHTSSMATPITYSVRVSSETHKIETWLASDEALARQLQEEENAHDAATTREFAGTAHSQNLSLRLREDNVDPDNMSYEQLQALGDAVGNESRGLSDDLISYLVPFKHKCNFFSRKKNNEEYVTVNFTSLDINL